VSGLAAGRSSRRALLLLAAGSLLFALGAAELAVRALGIGRAGTGSSWYAGGNHPRGLVRPDPTTGYALAPGFVGEDVAVSGEFRVPVRIDGEGLRDHPHDAAAPPRAHPWAGARILAVGDSMAYGEGVEVEEAWPALLERTTGARVVNGGVPGFASPQIARRAELLAGLERLRGDGAAGETGAQLVLALFSARWDLGRCADPFVAHHGFLVVRSWRPRLHLVNGNLYEELVAWRALGPATAALQGHSQLARAVAPALRRLAGRGPRRDHPPPRAGYRHCLTELATGARRLARRDARLLVVLADSPSAAFRRDTRLAAAELGRMGVTAVRLDALLRGSPAARRFPRDGHWHQAGHREVAAALAGWLESRGTAPGAAAGRRARAAGAAQPPARR
jgi:hypothetical protein